MVALAMPPPSHMVCRPQRARALELAEQRRHEPRTRAAERVTEGDRAAVHVDLLHVGVVLLRPREHHRSERLVDLDQIDLIERHLRPLEHLRRRRDRTGEHRDRVDAGERERVEAGARLEPELRRLLLAHDEHRGRTVGDLRRVGGGDDTVFLEGGLELGQRLHRRVGPDALVGRELLVARLGRHRDRHDLTIEAPSALACAARLCDRTENSSLSSRVMPHFSAISSAEMPCGTRCG